MTWLFACFLALERLVHGLCFSSVAVESRALTDTILRKEDVKRSGTASIMSEE